MSQPTRPPFDFDRFLAVGFHVWAGAFSAQAVERAIARGMALSGARRGQFSPAMQPHLEDPEFLELMREPAVVAVVEALVGGAAAGIQTEFFYSMPGTRGFSAHQDNFFVEAPSDQFVSVWVPLLDVGPDNGSLILWPMSHRFGKLPVRKTGFVAAAGQDANANTEETVLPPGLAPLDLVAPKGSAVFIHSELVHASHTNRSSAPRPVLLNTYIRAGARFRPGNTARRKEIPLREPR
jgi:ectoine hydroxylase-related dioxygenase (phytanoyl-CoA dioxygenase family)